MSYNASLTVSCAKQHTCVGCNSKFSYVLERSVTAEGSTEAIATTNAQNQAIDTIETQVDFHPCPQCGTVQPEMTADVKGTWAWLGIFVGVIMLIVSLSCAWAQVMTVSFSGWLGMIGALIALATFAYSAVYNPNKDLMSNQNSAMQEVQAQALSLDEAAPAMGTPMDEHGGITGTLGVAMGLIAVLLTFAPNGLRLISGWTANENCYPGVIGPGDETTVYFPGKKVQSIDGMWHGPASAIILNANELGLTQNQLLAETNDDNWGNSISTESDSNSHKSMWITITVPDDEQFANKQVDLKMDVQATYPFAYGVDDNFQDKREAFTYQAKLTLSSAGAGSTYNKAWWMGQFAAMALVFVGGLILAKAAANLGEKGNPTMVAPLE